MPDTTYQPKVYRTNGGDKMVVASGGEIDFESGGALKIAGTQVTSDAAELNKLDGCTATKDELNLTDGAPATVTMAAAAGGSNICEVTFTVKDAAGATIAAVHHIDVYLSDAATGQGLTGTSASGTVQAKSASGTDLQVYSAKKALRVQTLATGVYVLEITDSAKTTFYPCVVHPLTGKVIVGTRLVAGNYGA